MFGTNFKIDLEFYHSFIVVAVINVIVNQIVLILNNVNGTYVSRSVTAKLVSSLFISYLGSCFLSIFEIILGFISHPLGKFT